MTKLDSFLFYNRTIPYLKQDHNSDLAIQNRIQLLSPLVDQLPRHEQQNFLNACDVGIVSFRYSVFYMNYVEDIDLFR